MLYYRVKPEYDNYKRSRHYDIFVGNQLFTEKEKEKVFIEWINRNNYRTPFNLCGTIEQQNKFNDMFIPMNIPKSKIYWFFGARFEMVK